MHPGHTTRRIILCTRLDALLCERLNDIPNFKLAEIFKDDTTFITTGNFTDIVFAATQRCNQSLEDLRVLTQYTSPRGACDLAISDAAASDDDVLTRLKDLDYFGMAFDYLAENGIEHTG